MSGRNNKHQAGIENVGYWKTNDDRLSAELEECKRELMIKNGQIAMLEKLINQYLGKGGVEQSLTQESIRESRKESWEDVDKRSQKDQKITQHLEKINSLMTQIKHKN